MVVITQHQADQYLILVLAMSWPAVSRKIGIRTICLYISYPFGICVPAAQYQPQAQGSSLHSSLHSYYATLLACLFNGDTLGMNESFNVVPISRVNF
jgi:hypothetical protein